MPVTAFLHTHVLVVVLFLLLFAAKAVLLLLNKHQLLATVRHKTKVADILLGTLILITGAYLATQYNGGLPAWLILKIVLVLAAIPIGIAGLARQSKLLTVVALLLFLYVYGVAETNSLIMNNQEPIAKAALPDATDTPETDAVETGQPSATNAAAPENIIAAMSESQLANAKAIYTQVCASCHGADGAKNKRNAANLQVSQRSLNDRKTVIENGRGLMPAFGKQLSAQEVEMLAAYTMTLKK
ncbi:c-type cytochrome [Pontibacter liquoris]|uniref:c-type cytochrome n=1 Tax=Pontibacter liquoris TaxID=2905677 RepID=UPI001FA70D64|nr:cytochrome c [Pontibacter liquoris]